MAPKNSTSLTQGLGITSETWRSCLPTGLTLIQPLYESEEERLQSARLAGGVLEARVRRVPSPRTSVQSWEYKKSDFQARDSRDSWLVEGCINLRTDVRCWS